MSLPAITGVAPRWESLLAELLDRSLQVQLVRRCADVPELVGVATAGLARVAVVSSDFRSLDRQTVEALLDAGVAVVGLHPPGQAERGRALTRWGVPVVAGTDLDLEAMDEAIAAAVDGRAADERVAGDQAAPDHSLDRGLDHGRGLGGPLGPDVRTSGRTPPGVGEATPVAPRDGSDAALPPGVDPVDEELRRLVAEAGGSVGVPGQEGAEGAGLGDQDTWEPEPEPVPEPGQVVVVWGPGSPGRTTVAINLAAELADPLTRVLLIDADTYAASVAQCLAVLDEAPGLVAAARAADQGTLDRRLLATLAPEVRPGLQLLSGLPRADRWPEVRDSALADVIEAARRVFRYVVVDVAAEVEQDEELSFDTVAPRRNGATLTALEAADRVVVVGAGDPVGLQRLVRGLGVLSQLTGAPRDVVVTRVRPGPVGPDPHRRIQEALERFAGTRDVHLVPEDRDALDAALLHGQALAEARPGSVARVSIQQLADRVSGRPGMPRRAGGRWRLGRQRA